MLWNWLPYYYVEVRVEISKDGKKLTLDQLDKLYLGWISEMHDRYDEEIDGGVDKPIIVIVSSKIEKLDLTSDGKLYEWHLCQLCFAPFSFQMSW